MQSLFTLINSILALIPYTVYALAIVEGKAKPHRTTRFVLVLITAPIVFDTGSFKFSIYQ